MPPLRSFANPTRNGARGWLRLFDRLVGAGEDRGGHGEAQRLSSFEIDDQLECGRLLDWQIGRFGGFEDLSGVNAELAKDTREARSITNQTAGSDEFARKVDRWNGMA